MIQSRFTSGAIFILLALLLVIIPGLAGQWPDASETQTSLNETATEHGWQGFNVPEGTLAERLAWLQELMEQNPGAPMFVAIPGTQDTGPGAPNPDLADGVTTGTLLSGTPDQTTFYIIDSGTPGPTVLAVAGVHGDQPAGVAAAELLTEYRDLERGRLVVLPEANVQAVAAGARTGPDDIDINRTFPDQSAGQASDPRSQAVWDLIDDLQVDYLLALHEGADYQAVSSSIGQMVIVHPDRGADALADLMVSALNRDAQGDRLWRTGGPPVQGGLTRAAAEFKGLPAFHITTARLDSLDLRVSGHLTAVDTLLSELAMLHQGNPPDEPGEPDEPDHPDLADGVTTGTLLSGTPDQTTFYIIDSGTPGPTVLAVAGVHGDQPAGVAAAELLTEYRDLERGRLVVLPEANVQAVAAGARTGPDDIDINRTFPDQSAGQASDPRSQAVWDLIDDLQVDYLLALHEGADYQAVSSSIGQMVIVHPDRGADALADLMVSALNRDAQGDRLWRTGGPPVQGGLTRAAAEFKGLPAFHITTARLDSLDLRVSGHLTAVDTLLSELAMLHHGNPPELPSISFTTETLLRGTKYETTLYIIDSGEAGPTVWISGGVHGSEIAGWQAADQMVDWGVQRGKLLVLPQANVPAVDNSTRSGPGDPDLNRQFPNRTAAARGIWAALERHEPDWVIDLHEALSARNINSNSVGQTLIAYPHSDTIAAGNAIFAQVNPSISDPRYHFQVIQWPVGGSLARAAGELLGARAGIFETTRLVGLSTRLSWQIEFVERLLNHLDMGPARQRSGAWLIPPDLVAA
ncbi:MAG: succinylglutamate desuccinylase/aspartoacylase family protein [Thermaerobacterales bacterium]